MKISELKIGDTLCHSDNKHWYQTAIQLFSRSIYQHCSTVTGVNEIHEAVPEGYVNSKLSDRLSGRIIVKRPKFTFNPIWLVEEAKHLERSPYDYKGTFINQLIFNICDIFNRPRPKLKDNVKAWYCSEAAMFLYYYSTNARYFQNYQLSPAQVADDVTNFDTFELEF
jgi:hypothetical protein